MDKRGTTKKITALVIDASVALKWFLPGEKGEKQALDLLKQFSSGKISFYAPYLLIYEVINGLLLSIRRGRVPPELAKAASKQFLALQIRYDFPINEQPNPNLPINVELPRCQIPEELCPDSEENLLLNANSLHILDFAVQGNLTAYDAAYLDLASRCKAPLITEDQDLHDAAAKLNIPIICLEKWHCA